MPCADTEVNNLVHTTLELKSNHDNHSHDKANDLCSPFCICNCCAGSVLSFSSTVAFQTFIVSEWTTKQKITYKSVFASNFFGSIWQPPQIV